MKKTLIAMAALAATGAFAQLTVGGNFDQAVYNQGTGNTAASAWSHNANSTSLITVSGSHDLGDGLKGGLNLVSELNLMKGQVGSGSTGASVTSSTANAGQIADVFNRGANISLSGGFGTVTIGRQTDLWFSTQGSLNTSGSNSFGFSNLTSNVSNAIALRNLTGQTAANTAPAGLAPFGVNGVNDGNTGTAAFVFASGVGYTSPNFAGFQAGYQSLTANYNNGGVSTGNAYNLTYANGPLKLAVATSNKNDNAGAAAGWVNTVYGGSYNIGAFTVIAAINKTTFSGASSALDNMTTTALGLNYVFSPKIDMNVSYGTLVDDTNSANKATQMGVTARYKLNDRASLYAGLGNTKNEGASIISNIYAGQGVTATEKDTTTSAYMMGLKYTF